MNPWNHFMGLYLYSSTLYLTYSVIFRSPFFLSPILSLQKSHPPWVSASVTSHSVWVDVHHLDRYFPRGLNKLHFIKNTST